MVLKIEGLYWICIMFWYHTTPSNAYSP